jgi:hypothetical protein
MKLMNITVLLMLLLTSCCWKQHGNTEVGLEVENKRKQIVNVEKALSANIDSMDKNVDDSNKNADVVNSTSDEIDKHANKVKQTVINTPIEAYNDTVKNDILTDTDKIIMLNSTNVKLVERIKALNNANKLLLSQQKVQTAELNGIVKDFAMYGKKIGALVEQITVLTNEKAQLFKEKLYYIIVISVICFGICIAMMANPETTRWGKFGAMASFTVCGVCLALAYYGKEGAILVGVVLVVFLVYIIKQVMQTRTNHNMLGETVQLVELAKKEIEPTKFKAIAEQTQSVKTKKKIKVLRDVAKAKLAEVPPEKVVITEDVIKE